MSELDEVRIAGRQVLDALKQNAPNSSYIAPIEEAMRKLDDPAVRLEAVKALGGLAHPKALGDIYVEGVPGFGWPNMVSELSWVAGCYIKKFDPNLPTGRELGFSKEELAMLTKSTLPTYLYDPPTVQQRPFGKDWSSALVFIAKFILLPVAVVCLALLLVGTN